jgi:hypothetical protein
LIICAANIYVDVPWYLPILTVLVVVIMATVVRLQTQGQRY